MWQTPEIGSIFDKIAPYYDLGNRVLSFGLDRYWRSRALTLAEMLPGDKVLDICTGTGDFAAASYQRVYPGEVHGIDISVPMLEKCQEKYPFIQTMVGDAQSLPYSDNSFDYVTLAFGPRNIPDLQAMWSEIQRVLTPGGRVLTLELTRPQGTILGLLHKIFVAHILPLLGKFISGDGKAYRYLSDTVGSFMDPNELLTSMREAGFRDCSFHSLTGGIVTAHIGVADQIV